MRIRSITFLFIVFLLLSSLAVPVIASGCDPPCEGCQKCEEGVCVDDDSKCDTENCYECVNGNCEYQCDSTEFDLFCCDGYCCQKSERCCPNGSCASCCYEVENETTCSSANNIPCIACVGGLLGDCSNTNRTRIYTNAMLYDCIAGCPGDCPDDFEYIACYRTYLCKNGITYNFQQCSYGEGGFEPLNCYNANMPWYCKTCVPDYDSPLATIERGYKRCEPGT